MPLIFIIAWRNIFRHLGKTLVIGTILFLGALIMTIGNGIITGLNSGLQKNIVDQFTGDILLVSQEQETDSVLLSMTGQTVEPFSNFLDIKKFLKTQDYIEDFLPAGIGYVWILNENGSPIDQYMLGVEFAKYQSFFQYSVKAKEGELLAPDEKAVLVAHGMRKWIYDYCNYWVVPKGQELVRKNLSETASKNIQNLEVRDELVFMGLSRKNSSQDILLPVKGVFEYPALNSLLSFYSIVHIESLRECMGFFTAESTQSKIPEEQLDLLDLSSTALEDVFSESTIEVNSNDSALEINSQMFKVLPKNKINLDNEAGIFNLVFIRLKPDTNLNYALNTLNNNLKNTGLGVRAIPWNKATGILGQMALIMKGALFLFVMVIFLVAIIIIMNTLSMAAIERVSEIGMMRAVGARKWFISRMFLAETFLLSITFGGFGIFLGWIIIKILQALHLATTNEVLQVFYGGDTFHPFLTLSDFGLCVMQLLIVTLLAVIYPVIVARRITALDAICRD